ncbi:Cd2+/Zn2+-exporting ATPase [Alkalithermobacter thermoalcaliphilus JW-YL-7 = DSM 7308]|uniref:Cd2+/Zn2+-exporting ATPase n=1 Tax=Alkalithermobacter thermoalcaliphilus JW-YL-7 = DSM 7308 TaxID=1121328 RepID=A0A150FP90_CLOPD|nr:heavy metal translocating P-type ATPase [[Clostridium] paradoxum JW-YL-7 = DSM 7308]SHK53311.1 Cd2+/Zn2+-exporting ATPase [[Clostridium] paradoxum JW-YL-7 = DSM 7308]
MVIKEFILEGLACASCACLIEDEISKIDQVNLASLNFATKTLKVQIKDINSVYIVTRQIKDIIKNLEPDVLVFEKQPENKKHIYKNDSFKKNINVLVGAFIFVIAILFNFPSKVKIFLYTVSYIFIGSDVIVKAVKNLFRKKFFDENFLMSIATVGAFAIHEYPEAVSVMLFYKIGEFFQNLAVNKSRKSIQSLIDIAPNFANLKTSDGSKKVSPYEVNVSDVIIVKPGEKIPLDGIVIDGNSFVDTSVLTGESTPKSVNINDNVLSGYINKNGLLTIKVTKEFKDSTVSRILDLVENASSKKSPTEKFITKFSKYYTPIVVLLAISIAFIPPIFVDIGNFDKWIYRALVFLVVSCPCALVISIPLGFFGGIGAASANGILIKGSNYLEALTDIDIAVFDKTGTLTEGVFEVCDVKIDDCFDKDFVLDYVAVAESYSNHPIATSILKYYGKKTDTSLIDNFEEIPGYGIKASIQGNKILIGNEKLMKENNICFESTTKIGTVVYIAINDIYAGYIIISDKLKEDSKKTIDNLKLLGIKNIMLTGDNENIAKYICDTLELDKFYANLLPHEKVEKLEQLYSKNLNKKILFVGDGINDAPVIARADVGICMGALGSDSAIEASDIVIMTNSLYKLVEAIKISKFTKKIVIQNITLSLLVKGLVIILGSFGIATMWEAVFADVGVALISILNAIRILKFKSS